MPVTLGLDISKNSLGWCLDGVESQCPPRCGTWTDAKKWRDIGKAGHAYQTWLYKMIRAHGIELVAYEAPMMGGTDKRKGDGGLVMNEATAFVLIGMAFSTEVIAAAAGARHIKAHVQTVRRYFVGNGRPENPKDVVRRQCERLGWSVKNTDESDAAAVWSWAQSTNDKKFRLDTGPLVLKG